MATNTLSIGAANVWAIMVSLVALPLQLRGLGAVTFGTWVLLQTFSAVNGWLSLADLGVGAATTRAVAAASAVDDEPGVARVVASAGTIFLILGVTAGLAVALLGPPLMPALFHTPADLVPALKVAIPLFALQVVFDFLTQGMQSTLEGFQRIDLSRLADSVRRTGVAVATAVVALRGGGLTGVVAVSMAASAAGTALGIYLVVRHGPRRLSLPSKRDARGLISYGSSVAVLSTTGVVVRTMDRLIVGLALGPGPVSLVEIATQVINGASAVLSAAAYAVTPAAAWVKARGAGSELKELAVRGTKFTLVVAVPVIVGAMAMVAPLIRVWVGARYSDAVLPTEIGLTALLVAAPLQVGSNLLQGVGKVRAMWVPVLGGHGVNLVVSIVLVYAVGVPGVFIGTLVGTLIYIGPLARAALRESGVRASEWFSSALLPLAPPTLLFAVVAGAAALTPLPDLLRIGIGISLASTLYSLVVWRWALNPVDRSDLRGMLR